jgi:uroporphyrin-III C-methyltransferase/precorrin-2 dehydrogenase/sirohydrochlorin ferrochelatase
MAVDTAVIYMGAGQADKIAATLIARGMAPETPIAVVENASLPTARCMTMRLSELPRAKAAGLTGPAVILLGQALAAAQHDTLEPLSLHIAAA